MHKIALVLISVLIASCTMGPPEPSRDAQSQMELQRMLAGRTPGKPISCLPSYYNNDMRIIDGRNVAFRVGTRILYLMHLSRGCELLGSGNYALVTRESGGMGTCRGDIARVFDTSARIMVGSCGVDDIIPYTAGARP